MPNMKKISHTIELMPVRREVLSPADFARLAAERPHAIARSRFIAPRPGDKDFGRFEVVYDVPQLRPAANPA